MVYHGSQSAYRETATATPHTSVLVRYSSNHAHSWVIASPLSFLAFKIYPFPKKGFDPIGRTPSVQSGFGNGSSDKADARTSVVLPRVGNKAVEENRCGRANVRHNRSRNLHGFDFGTAASTQNKSLHRPKGHTITISGLPAFHTMAIFEHSHRGSRKELEFIGKASNINGDTHSSVLSLSPRYFRGHRRAMRTKTKSKF